MLLQHVSKAQWNGMWKEFGANFHTKPLLYLTLSMCLIMPLLAASVMFQKFDVTNRFFVWAFGIDLYISNPLHLCFYISEMYYLFSVSYMISIVIVNVLFAACTVRFWLQYSLKMLGSDRNYEMR